MLPSIILSLSVYGFGSFYWSDAAKLCPFAAIPTAMCPALHRHWSQFGQN